MTATPPVPSLAGRLRSLARERGFLWPAFVLTVGVLVSVLTWRWVCGNENEEAARLFDDAARVLTHNLQHNLESYASLGHAARGLVAVQPQITAGRWQRFAAETGLRQRYPGLHRIVYVKRVAAADLAGIIARRRVEGPAHFELRQPGARPEYYLLTYAEPGIGENDHALGYDFATESVRRETMERARDSGLPAVSARLVLIEDLGSPRVAYALMLPVYAGAVPATLEERRRALTGLVVLVFRLDEVVAAAMADQYRGLALRVSDGDGVVYDGQSGRALPDSAISHKGRVELSGHGWELNLRPTAEFAPAQDRRRSDLTLAVGLSGTLLVTLLVWLMATGRSRAEALAREMTAELHASAERLRLVMDATRDGIWDRDLIGGSYYLSPALGRIFGVELDGRCAAPLARERIHPDDLPRWEAALKAHLEHAAPYDVELRVRHEDGRWLWVRSRGQAIRDASGRPVRMVGALSDITAEREEEDRLERYRQFLVRLLDTIPDAVSVKDGDLRFTIVNRAFAAMTGQPAENIVGRRTGDFYPPEVTQAVEGLDRRVLAHGLPASVEVPLFNAARGGRRVSLLTKVRGEGPAGETLVVGIHHDVTAIRAAEQTLRESEERFRHLSAMASDWFWEQDAQFRFTHFSAPLARHGLDIPPVIGQHRWDLPIDLSAEQWAQHRADLEAHRPFRDFEYRIREDSGRQRWVSINGDPLFDAAGNFTGYRGTSSDITERKRLDDELRAHRDHLRELVEAQTLDLLQAKERAEQASQAKSDFLNNISHELRTPLHAILSFARLGESRSATAPPDKLREYFQRIESGGGRLLHLLNDLLDLSKLEAGKMTMNIEPHDLRQLVQEVAHDLEPLFESRQVRLRMQQAGDDLTAPVDAVRFGQVMRNLLSNALKFTAEGSTVGVSFGQAELPAGRRGDDLGRVGAVRILVEDEGIGIPADELEVVFDKFIQSSKTRTGAGGTGLGLAICREIVQEHRGTIVARNRPQGGAVFEVLLPR